MKRIMVEEKKKKIRKKDIEEELVEKNVTSKKSKWKMIVIILTIVVLFFLVGFLIYLKVTSDFKYDKYNKKVEVNYQEKYIIKAPIVCYGNIVKCNSVKAKIEGKVDSNKLGNYKIKYIYKYKKKELVLEQTIIVKDMVEPTIKVNEETIKICPNGKILNIEMEASDNLDGDLTDKIVSNVKGNKLLLEVEDSSNNKAKKELDVILKDDEAPKIKLNGKSSMSTIIGLEYTDEGATATDNCDGEVAINVSGTVDYKTKGTYKITYSTEDSSGNKSSIERSVTVKDRTQGDKIIYLTFDDGPGAYTQKLLDILDKYDVKVTFFVTNQFPKYQYLIGEEAKRGHAIAVHSLTHKWNIYDSVEAYRADFDAMNDIIEQQTGFRTKLFRFPGGSSNTVYCSHNKTAVPDIVKSMTDDGYVYFDWNLSSGDAGGTTSSEQVYKNVINGLSSNSSVVLQHDIKSFSVNAVENIIKYGLNNGYTFKKLDETSPTAHHGMRICK